MRVVGNLVDGSAHFRRCGTDLIDRHVLLVDQFLLPLGNCTHLLGSRGNLQGGFGNVAYQPLQLLQKGVECLAQLAQFVIGVHHHAAGQVALAVCNVANALQQLT